MKPTKTEILEDAETIEDGESSMVVKFSKPYEFEGEKYESIDLSGVEDLTGQDMIELQKTFFKGSASAKTMAMPEMDLGYAFLVANKVTKLPLEFFENLPARECIKVRTKVTQGFFGSD